MTAPSPIDLAEIEARANAVAEENPHGAYADGNVLWTAEPEQRLLCCGNATESGECCGNPRVDVEWVQSQIGYAPEAFLRFAVAALQDIPALLARLRASEEEKAQAVQEAVERERESYFSLVHEAEALALRMQGWLKFPPTIRELTASIATISSVGAAMRAALEDGMAYVAEITKPTP